MVLNYSFPKSRRLRKRADYLAVQRTGKTQHCRYFVLVSVKQAAVVSAEHAQQRESGRLGITVSKKVGNSVTRNRVKRVVREFVRRAVANLAATGATGAPSGWLPARLDVVVIAKKSAGAASTTNLWSSLESCRAALHKESAQC